MSKDEAIKLINDIKKEYGTMDALGEYVTAIDTILDLYKQEKEKNKETNLHYVPYEQYITKLNEANEKWKDKIRAKIKELEEEQKEYKGSQEWEIQDNIDAQINILKELLERR